MRARLRAVAAAVLLLMPAMARAQQQESAPPPPTVDLRDAADRRPNLVEPDFTIINLPTTLRLPRYKSAFRISPRFTRTLNNDFGPLASNLFGLDSGALIGLEYRFGVMRGLQAGIYRTSGRTIRFFGQYDAMRQTTLVPFTLNVVASIEGLNNLCDDGRHRVEHTAGRIERARPADAGRVRGGLVDAPRKRLPAWRLTEDVRHREAAAQARLSTECIQLARHDRVRNGARSEQQSRPPSRSSSPSRAVRE